jgi:plasmid stabilization system protein ParE
MVIDWTDNAKQRLRDIFDYYQVSVSRKVALKMAREIWQAAKPLADFPYMAAIEPVLAEFPETFRSVVVRDIFKIIYYVDNNIVYIVSVWDCRQDPGKMKDSVR